MQHITSISLLRQPVYGLVAAYPLHPHQLIVLAGRLGLCPTSRSGLAGVTHISISSHCCAVTPAPPSET